MKTRILYEDASFMVIHKPAGIAVQSARIGQMDVESELKNYLAAKAQKSLAKQSMFVGLVHRLDQPVEGLLVVAKTRDAAAKLNKQLAEGSLNKKYLAVVYLSEKAPLNSAFPDSADFVDYIVKDGQVARIEAVHAERKSNDAKEARLFCCVLQRQGNIALTDIKIETGRFHQIRCQMAHHGMPLLGDAKYGSNASVALSQELGIRNVALCANRIAFKHPATGKILEFEVQPSNPAFTKFSKS